MTERIVGRGEDIPAEDMKLLFWELIQFLGLQIVVEETPDYVSFSLRTAGGGPARPLLPSSTAD